MNLVWLGEHFSFCDFQNAGVSLKPDIKLGKAEASRMQKKKRHAKFFVSFNGIRL